MLVCFFYSEDVRLHLLTRHKRDGKEKYVIDVIIEGLSFIEVVYLSLTGL